MNITLVTGGARSGKSTFAEELAKQYAKILYIATSKNEDGMDERIQKHRARRPAEWGLLEKFSGFLPSDFAGFDVALVDCATVMTSNNMFTLENLEEASESSIFEAVWPQFQQLLDSASAAKTDLIIVTNEVGLGLVSPYKLGNQFRDLAGAVNKELAKCARDVYLMVSGISLKIK